MYYTYHAYTMGDINIVPALSIRPICFHLCEKVDNSYLYFYVTMLANGGTQFDSV